MSEAEYSLAQDRFMRTLQAAGWDGMTREDFVEYMAVPCALTLPYRVEARRLVVHHLHMLANKERIDTITSAEATHLYVNYTSREAEGPSSLLFSHRS